jgi:CO/xanthine dehydrogenase Mo-binding subunit
VRYCLKRWLLTAAALLRDNPHASDEDLRRGLSGLKCRVRAHMAILRAVKRAREDLAARASRPKRDTMPEPVVTHRGVTRREFLKSGGAIVVSFGIPASVTSAADLKAGAEWPVAPDAAALDSWLRIAADGSVTASVGQDRGGDGIGTAFAQIVAEELDVPIERVTIVMGDTATTVDQRGTGSSNAIVEGGAALRKAAAEGAPRSSRSAAERLGVPAEALSNPRRRRLRGGRAYEAGGVRRSHRRAGASERTGLGEARAQGPARLHGGRANRFRASTFRRRSRAPTDMSATCASRACCTVA